MAMNKENQKNSLSWINQVIGRKKIYIFYLLLLQAMLGGSSVFYAVLFRSLIDEAVAGNIDAFWRCVIQLVTLVIFQLVMRAMGRFLLEWTRSTMENQFKERLFSSLLYQDYASMTAVHSGEWMNRLTSDTVVVASGLTRIIPGVGGLLVKLIGAIFVILTLEPLFAAILIPGGILMLLLTYSFRKVLKQLHKQVQEKDGLLRVFLQERLSSMMIIRAFGMEEQSREEASAAMKEHQKARIKRNHFSNLCNIGFGTAMNGLYVFGAVFCGYGLLSGTMSYGTLMAILQLINQIQSPFANITGYLPQYYSMIASAERLMEAEIHQEDICKTLISAREMKKIYQNAFDSLGLKNASFTYQPPVRQLEEKMFEREMPVVFNGIDLEIQKGEYVAFTGPSGCGKSTILKLLMCLYPLDNGERYLKLNNGGKIQKQELTSAWRGLFAYVPQGNQLMSGTIREIITFGDKDRMQDEKAIWNALNLACADGFVHELEQGLDTSLGERGAGLSEGQMQRIAIARAIFSDRPILLLDESTSALDEQTEWSLLNNLKAMTDKTVLIVTHRSAVKTICKKQIVFSSDGIDVKQSSFSYSETFNLQLHQADMI